MVAEAIAVADGSVPPWAIVLIALVGPVGLSGMLVKLGGTWLAHRRDMAAEAKAEREKRERLREDERRAFIELPGAIRQMNADLCAKFDALGADVRRALEVVSMNERERAQADAEQRAQMATFMIELAERVGVQKRGPAPSSSGFRGKMPSNA
jgi:hypothetical protein